MKKTMTLVLIMAMGILSVTGNRVFADDTDGNTPVNFVDSNLERYLRISYFYDLPEGEPITRDMMTTVHSVSLTFCDYNDEWECELRTIRDFSGIEYALNLEYITMDPEPGNIIIPENLALLSGLQNARYLNLGIAQSYDTWTNPLTETETNALKDFYLTILSELGNTGFEEVLINYMFVTMDYSWIVGLDLHALTHGFRNYFEEMPSSDVVNYTIETNDDGDIVYRFRYENPINTVYVGEDGFIREDSNRDYQNLQIISYGESQLDESRIAVYDSEGNEVDETNFSYLEFELSEAEFQNLNQDMALISLSMFQESSTTETNLSLHNLVSIYVGEETTTPEPIQTYTVQFNSHGGSDVASITNVESGSKIAQPSNPSRVGYNFEGWYQSENYELTWDFESDSVVADTTLHAKWSMVLNPEPTPRYTVRFDSHGGTSVASQVNLAPNSLVEQPGIPTREGYHFVGWYQQATYMTSWDFENDTVNEDIVLHAQWQVSTGPVNPDENIQPKLPETGISSMLNALGFCTIIAGTIIISYKKKSEL
ncbi:InlB B-repeat-containing protein [Erysipelothrix sp. HDW6C]|uniref:InlB B-repeat-containing protein n=1 Tax=Erysipelothrix sp. HDW6C TaxID=2714930 RepID=UPI00140C1A4B|nr:InlB B-repeat-containing protein [Erysipelothrix sp. HDW6C]QIK69438.1 InlB B-repeat-containing protein [Erysipelothrix sp. HDW6C]